MLKLYEDILYEDISEPATNRRYKILLMIRRHLNLAVISWRVVACVPSQLPATKLEDSL
jgi:hypothetical protein